MIKKLSFIFGCALLGGASYGSLLTYDGFGFYDGSSPIEDQVGGGFGWSSPSWYPANPNTTIDDYFYSDFLPLTNPAFTGTGLPNGFGSTYFDFGLNINAHNVIERQMTSSFNGDSGGTFYFSYLLGMTEASVLASNVARFSVQMPGESTRRIFLETAGDELQYRVAGSPGGGSGNPQLTITTSSNPFAGGGTFFIVGKVTLAAGAGNDQFYANVYSTGSVGAEPGIGGWLLETTPGAGSSLDAVNEFSEIALVSGLGDGNSFDEVRVGQSWFDVTGVVPEPSTYALFAGLLALGLSLSRRRSRGADRQR